MLFSQWLICRPAEGRVRRAGRSKKLGAGKRRSLRQCRFERLEERTVLSGGVVLTSAGDASFAYASFLDSNENLVVAGSASFPSGSCFALLRYTPNGLLDPTFGGGDGVVTTNFKGGGSVAYAAAAYPEGRIVVGGKGGGDFALARYNGDGQLDRTFGKNGQVQTDLGGVEEFEDLTVQPDGKIVVGGSSAGRWTLARYTASGQLDSSFGSGGIVQSRLGDGTADFTEVWALGLHQGKILAVGWSGSNVALVRYNLDGSLDDGGPNDTDPNDSFGTGGIVISESINGAAFAIQNDGKIVLGGDAPPGTVGSAVARYNSDGSVDQGFGQSGVAVVAPGGFQAVGIQPDGKVVGAVWWGDDAFGAARFNPNGSLDDGGPNDTNPTDSFGTGGIAYTKILRYHSVQSMVIQSDGRITVIGWAEDATRKGFIALVRYNPNGTLDDTFGVAANSPPVAVDDSATTDEDTPVTINVLANDSDPDGDALAIESVTTPGHGTALVNQDGTITYTPEAGFTGSDSFDYTVTDGNGGTDGATVAITVNPLQPSQISINNVSLREGRAGKTTTFTFTVTRTGDTSQATTIWYATAEDTAKLADNDYVAASGWLTFAAGETTKTISVTVNGDGVKEEDEFFFLRLSLTDEDLTAIATGVGTIINDDK